jgi:PAS domain S-box-containing protein
MAAGFARALAPRNVEIVCAGDRHWPINSGAERVMKEAGIPVPPEVEHTIEEIASQPFDVVITLCNSAREKCPTLPGSPARIHWPLVNPAGQVTDPAVLRDTLYQQVLDAIRRRVKALFQDGFLESILQVRITFTSLLDNLTDGVMAHDLDRRIYYFNGAAQQITGYDAQEVIGRDCHEVFSGRFCGGDCSFCEGQRTTRPRVRYPESFARKSGEVRELEMSVVTVNAPNGEETGALVIFRDITEIRYVRRKLEESRGFQGIIGRHPLMLKLYDTIQELSDADVPILVQGGSGTGKELVANALHLLGPRASGPFVPVNCGALPEGVLESELFGHVKGAFTGAIRDKKGRFELAEGGTLFLDEIGEISPHIQVRLLRVLQERAFIPVGGERTIQTKAGIICATNRDLKELTAQGLFRDDLYYRLAVVPFTLPALKARASDIPLLVDHFIEKYSSDSGKRVSGISREAMDLLMSYAWPGNVRELINAIQYGMIKCQGGMMELRHLPPELSEARAATVRTGPGRPVSIDPGAVARSLKKAGGNKAKAARLLGISRTSLYRYLRKSDL